MTRPERFDDLQDQGSHLVLADGSISLPGSSPVLPEHGVAHVHVRADTLEDAVQALADAPGGRLADLFAAVENGRSLLRTVWALDADGTYVVAETPVDGERYPPLSPIAPAAFLEECEIYEQFGLRPRTGKPLNRVMLPPHAGLEFPRLGRPPRVPPREMHAPHVVGGHAFEFPYGPVRSAGQESLYYGLVTSGEEVVDLYLFTWHKHRGVEFRLRGRDPARALFLVERVEGLSAVANGWAFAAAVEQALEIVPPPEAGWTRAIALELERLYNHAQAIAALGQSTGLSVGQADGEIAVERLLRLNAAVFGHRYLFGVVAVGGAAKAPDLDALRRDLPGALHELRRLTDALSRTNSFLDRLEATGIVTGEQAARLGLVGPVARAAGAAIDARRDHTARPYDREPPSPAARVTGDVLARYQVFLGEIEDSARLLSRLADSGPVTAGTRPLPRRQGSGLGWAESLRGESLAWVALDGEGCIRRARLRPASVRNWRAFDDAARSQNVFTDIPIIEASFWLTVAGTAR
ncbi:MAG: nickel-dependent hydrogenase large subunit [Streptosporangiaceae bacterium]